MAASSALPPAGPLGETPLGVLSPPPLRPGQPPERSPPAVSEINRKFYTSMEGACGIVVTQCLLWHRGVAVVLSVARATAVGVLAWVAVVVKLGAVTLVVIPRRCRGSQGWPAYTTETKFCENIGLFSFRKHEFIQFFSLTTRTKMTGFKLTPNRLCQ